jgi:hypothetical protein
MRNGDADERPDINLRTFFPMEPLPYPWKQIIVFVIVFALCFVLEARGASYPVSAVAMDRVSSITADHS